MLESALLALFACLVPLVIMLGVSVESSVWAISSGIVVFGDVAYVVGSRAAYREVIDGAEGKGNAAVSIFVAGDGLMASMLIAYAAGWPFENSLQAFFTARVVQKIPGVALSFRELVRLAWSGRA